MSELEKQYQLTGKDPLAEATRGRHHWNDAGMDDFEKGWEEFVPGQRVEVLTENGWLSGTVREVPDDTGRGIHVECDMPWHTNMGFYEGKGAFVNFYCNTRRGLWSVIRGIPTPVESLGKE